jgi:hypothetical protein
MPSHAQPLRSRAGGHDRSDRACKVDDTRLMVPCRAWLGMANPKAAASGGWRICAGISPKASHRRRPADRRHRRCRMTAAAAATSRTAAANPEPVGWP